VCGKVYERWMGTRMGRIDAHAGLWMDGWDSGKRFQHEFFSCISYSYPDFHHPRAGLSAGSFLNSPRLLFISLEMAVNRG